MNQKVALITGITGQDGSYLAELLLSKDYVVHGIIRRSSNVNTHRIEHIFNSLHLHYGDVTDSSCLLKIISLVKPNEIYHLAAQSHVKVSFDMPDYTTNVDALGALRILEAVKACGLHNFTKFYNASTSEQFGKIQEELQSEKTSFYPRSPYGCAKLYAHCITINYRESYNMFAVNGILFNHGSERRGITFVERKITIGVAKIHYNKQDCLVLGNLDAKRDWGHAKDYVYAMWLMLQKSEPQDYVIGTGEKKSVREIVEIAFKEINKSIVWRNSGIDEIGVDKESGKILVKIDAKYFRPAEVDVLCANNTKATKELGWSPKITLNQMIAGMVKYDKTLIKESTVHCYNNGRTL